MASGFAACHPDQVKRLEALGLPSDSVTQGVGYASASAGTHGPVGVKDGKPYAHCIDLSPNALPFQRSYFDKLVEQGLVPFPREVWPSGGAHWHVVDATRPLNDAGEDPDHKDIVNHQLAEWVTGGDGLVGEAPMPAKWKPTLEQRAFVRKVWKDGKLPEDTEETKPVKVIDHATGAVKETLKMVSGGDHIADQGKLYVEA